MRMFILSQALVYDLIRFFLCVFEKMWPIKGTCVNRSRPECDPYVQKTHKVLQGASRMCTEVKKKNKLVVNMESKDVNICSFMSTLCSGSRVMCQ